MKNKYKGFLNFINDIITNGNYMKNKDSYKSATDLGLIKIFKSYEELLEIGLLDIFYGIPYNSKNFKISVVDETILNIDLEASYSENEYVLEIIKNNEKLYYSITKTEYPFATQIEMSEDLEVSEIQKVKPKQKTITVYEPI